MSPELEKEISFELRGMEKTVAQFKGIFDRIQDKPSEDMEIISLAALLHAFYSGVENIFKRIALRLDGGLPKGEAWHRELLDSMLHDSPNRPAVISLELYNRLQNYLGFRHLFRNIYPINLRWVKIKPLLDEFEITFSMLKSELIKFVGTC